MGENRENQENGLLMEIQCPGKGEVLAILRHFVCSVAEAMGFCKEEIAKIEISVDEACSNVVCHAYEKTRPDHPDMPGSLIRIAIKAASDHLQITIMDDGVGLRDGPHCGVHNLEEYKNRGHGLGTYIIKKFMDKVDISHPEGSGTIVSMVKFLPPSE